MAVFPVAMVFITFLTSYTLVYGSMIWILFGFSLIAFLNSYIFRKVFAKYEPNEEAQDLQISEELPQQPQENGK